MAQDPLASLIWVWPSILICLCYRFTTICSHYFPFTAIYKLHRVAAKRFIRADIGLHEAKVYEKFREQLHEPTIQQQNERLDDNGLTNDILSSPIKPIFFSKYRYLILMPLYEENLSDFRERYLKQMKKIIDDMTLMFLLREMVIVYVPDMIISLQ